MILTVTLNPSLDRTLKTRVLRHEQRVFASESLLHPGGKGINVSRVLTRLGTPNSILTLSGGPSGLVFESLCKEEHLNFSPLKISENIRTNLTLIQECPRREFKINELGPRIHAHEVEKFFILFVRLVKKYRVCVLAGNTPPGFLKSIYKKLITLAHKSDCKVVLDAEGDIMVEGIKAKPWLIKPNRHELELLSGSKISSIDDVRSAGVVLLNKGIQNVLVSLDSGGAILMTHSGAVYHARAPKVKVASSIGAGDSAVGGFLHGFGKSGNVIRGLQFAVAAGTATVTQPGTGLGSKQHILTLARQIKVHLLG
ncbi:MAG: 1-phosphofructokinase family hexose kinase [Verrucomicrobiota bacterium]|nr:1-phosphofructokinase family hexose kinase [Verrucomicrobiota bacterium]